MDSWVASPSSVAGFFTSKEFTSEIESTDIAIYDLIRIKEGNQVKKVGWNKKSRGV
jgi:hypothetical protein